MPLADLDPHRHEPLELLEKMVPHMAFTEPWNATGQPALSLPLAHSREGLPVGVQLVAAPGREDWLFGVAAELLPATRRVRRRRLPTCATRADATRCRRAANARATASWPASLRSASFQWPSARSRLTSGGGAISGNQRASSA